MMGKMMAAGVDLTIQSRPRQASWMAVKRWTLHRGTCLKNRRSGWCLAGINNSCTLFMNWGNKRRRTAGYSGSLKSVTVSYYGSALGAVRRLPCCLLTQSMAAESLYPGQAGKEDRRGIGKRRQEVPAGKKRRRNWGCILILMGSPGCC